MCFVRVVRAPPAGCFCFSTSGVFSPGERTWFVLSRVFVLRRQGAVPLVWLCGFCFFFFFFCGRFGRGFRGGLSVSRQVGAEFLNGACGGLFPFFALGEEGAACRPPLENRELYR